MLTGRGKLFKNLADQISDAAAGLECAVLVDGELAALMRFRDEPRSETRPFLQHVKSRHGIKSVVLLSGDRPSEVALFAANMGITHEYGGKSPEEKVAIVRELTAKQRTLYIGDGINDAPAMMNATAGVALGVNSDITSEAAGAVILQSSLQSVDELIHIGTRMRRIALSSAVGGMGLSAIGMVASALGFLAPIEGAILQEVIDLLAILNSLRMLLPTASIGDFKFAETGPSPALPHPSAAVTMPR
jgi:P-type E1-E2 ATPase